MAEGGIGGERALSSLQKLRPCFVMTATRKKCPFAVVMTELNE